MTVASDHYVLPLAVVLVLFAVSSAAAATERSAQVAATPSSEAPTGSPRKVGAPSHPPAESQEPSKPDAETPKRQDTAKPEGLGVPNTERLRVRARFLAAYGVDNSQSTLGFESQGRIGYAVLEVFGKLTDGLSYRIEMNPVNESQPIPSCGEAEYYFPNTPQNFGPNVACHNDGRVRVDDYRFIALDLINQQGAIRQAYVRWDRRPVSLTMGRFILPIGFGAEEVGSFTAKDATHIQRLNAEGNFGLMFSAVRRLGARRSASFNAAAFLGDGNRFHDYNYFYSLSSDLETNSAFTTLVSGAFSDSERLEFRAAFKHGYTGSNVERLPNYFASKRNDRSLVLSARYQPIRPVTLFGEYARYAWGPTPSAATMVGVDPEPIHKAGYYVGIEARRSLSRRIVLGTTITREELSRDDSLIKYLTHHRLYGVETGRKERAVVLRFYVDVSRAVRIGVYRNNLSNPFPWASGITPVSGQTAFTGRGSSKWGAVVRFELR